MTQIKTIKIPENADISLVSINYKRYIIVKKINSDYKFYIYVPENISIIKPKSLKNLLISTKEIKNILFDQFCTSLEDSIKNIKFTYKKKLLLKGLGYRMNLVKNTDKIRFKIGFSHFVYLKIPKTVIVRAKKTYITIKTANKVLLGNFVNRIKCLKTPDSYKGKGFWHKYQNQKLKELKKK